MFAEDQALAAAGWGCPDDVDLVCTAGTGGHFLRQRRLPWRTVGGDREVPVGEAVVVPGVGPVVEGAVQLSDIVGDRPRVLPAVEGRIEGHHRTGRDDAPPVVPPEVKYHRCSRRQGTACGRELN